MRGIPNEFIGQNLAIQSTNSPNVLFKFPKYLILIVVGIIMVHRLDKENFILMIISNKFNPRHIQTNRS